MHDIQFKINEWINQHNHHPVRTRGRITPLQMYTSGMYANGVRGLGPSANVELGPVAYIGEELVDEDCGHEPLMAAELADRNGRESTQHVQVEDHQSPFILS